MLLEQTIEQLHAMKLTGMAEALAEQSASTCASALSFEERIGLLVDHQWNWRENRALRKRIKAANFKLQACIEDVDFRTLRGITKSAIAPLSLSNWIEQHQNCIITGPTGVGKTFLACAIGHKACRNGYRTLYYSVRKLFRELLIASEEGNLNHLLTRLSKINLLVIDDWGMDGLSDEHYRDVLEILDDRHESASTLITSQLPLKTWHDHIGNPTMVDAMLDRIIHNLYKIEKQGESKRKPKSFKKMKMKTKGVKTHK